MEHNMKLVSTMKKALGLFLEESENTKPKQGDEMFRSIFTQLTSEDNPVRKIKELEGLIYQLSGKITVLVDKVHELNAQISNLTTLHEELLYTIDQEIGQLEQQEDNLAGSNLNSKEKKFGLN
jgi:predicted  nucleic acid-binding Zn-ribbon protein